MASPARTAFITLIALFLLAALARPSIAGLVDVDEAGDVCAPGDDPCIVFDRVATVPGAVLDFGLRTVEVIGDGGFDIGSGSLTVRCGPFSAVAKLLVDGKAAEDDDGGSFQLEARGSCADDPAVPCLSDGQCATGTCSVGSTPAVLGGAIVTRGRENGGVVVLAAGDIVVDAAIDATSTLFGGSNGVYMESFGGSLTVNERIRASGGAYGGEIFLTTDRGLVQNSRAAGIGDIEINARLESSATDEAGTVWLQAGGDLRIDASLTARASGNAGDFAYGGYIVLFAGGDITVAPRVRMVVDGAGAGDKVGDGGQIEAQAEGSLTIPEKVLLRARSGPGDAYGGDVYLTAGTDLDVTAKIDVSGRGRVSGAGGLSLESGGDLKVGDRARVRLRGPYDSGSVFVESDGDADIGGRYQVTTKDGRRGVFDVVAGGDVTVTAKMKVTGEGVPQSSFLPISITGCDVTIAGGADLNARIDPGTSRITAREQLTIEAGAKLSADPTSGTNLLVHRDPGKPPLVSGSVTPAPVVDLDGALPACP